MASSESVARPTVLVVDDAEAIRKMVCAMLLKNGYRCLEACDGRDALQRLQDESVHLVLTDVLMPVMGGAELADRLAAIRPELRIIFMSGYAEDPRVQHVQRAPTLFLPKPFTAGALVSKIRQVLDEPWRGLNEDSSR